MAIVDDSLVFARPTSNGFTYTLASRLGDMLCQAEAEFGPRDKTFTILGIEFKDGIPQVWFPGNCTNVVVQLGHQAMQEPIRALFQLAHECVHLLDPHPGGSSVLEEGTAMRFAHRYLAAVGCSMESGDPRYDTARQFVDQLIATRADAVKELRHRHGPLRSVTAAQIKTVSPQLDAAIAQSLVQPF